MKNFNELNKNELLEVVKEYSDYVTEYCFDNDIEPVSINEFYYEDYQEIPHVGDMVIIGGDIKEDVEWAENNSLGLSTGFIVISKNGNTITVKGDKEEKEISYESVWGIYKNVSDYVFWLDSEK